jgi:hypothetical protein
VGWCNFFQSEAHFVNIYFLDFFFFFFLKKKVFYINIKVVFECFRVFC